MDFDQFMDFVARSEALHHEIAKNVCKRLQEQPGFLVHEDEIMAEYDATNGSEGGILTLVTNLVNAYKLVMTRDTPCRTRSLSPTATNLPRTRISLR
jgi:hypothetical protein